MGVELLVMALIVLMLIAALVAVEARDLLSSVICLGAAGFALSVIDLLVGAPDLAITQVVVEVVALVLLIRVVVTRRDTSAPAPRDALRTGAVLLAGGVLLVAVVFSVGAFAANRAGTIPAFGKPLLAGDSAGVGRDYLANAARETGAVNIVTAVLLAYRAYDTLGEATVIFVSIIGAYAILRHTGRRRLGEDLLSGDVERG
ncbi:MAG: hydrogen gas-evolving membrane-bound hydrogenase subunit E [Planctomycetota bacterium]|jgi:multisubunit Na+/H+ antiporter MnhB subunit